MKKILSEIQSGKFAKEWMDENKNGRPVYKKYRESYDNHAIEKVGKELRAALGWNEDLTKAQEGKAKKPALAR
jgi:ketol-acid reductoisomerase